MRILMPHAALQLVMRLGFRAFAVALFVVALSALTVFDRAAFDGAVFDGTVFDGAVFDVAARADDVPDDSLKVPAEPRGTLMIIGGFERVDNNKIWDELLELCGGAGARIAVFPTASDFPLRNGNDLVDHLNEMGADAFLVPVGIKDFEKDYKDAVDDPKLIEQVTQAQGVFFIGGEQARIRDALLTKNGGRTAMCEAVWNVYNKGGVVAGSSAGAAIMSRIMYRDAEHVLATMLNGVAWGREVDHGLGFLPRDWFVDQHFLVRGRLGRSLVAMHGHKIPYGVGIDEDTALIVEPDGNARVVGYRGVVVIDLTDAKADEKVEGFNLKNVRLGYIGHGDRLNLRTREITPSQEKLDDRKVDPSDPDFRPFFKGRLFYNDILGNTTVLDMMYKLIDNRYSEGVGLAFDGAAARQGTTPGFEFRFRREKDSVGWNTEISGNDEYTIMNLYLDVKPITIKGPLYE